MTMASPPPASYTTDQAKEVFLEDTEHILANFRYFLELPLMTQEQKHQVKAIMGSVFALRREIQEGVSS